MQEDAELLQLVRFLLVGSGNVTHHRCLHLLAVLQIQFMPFLRRHLALVAYLADIVQCLLVNDVQDDFRVHVATGRTRTGLCIGIVGCFLEISDGINGIAVEYGITALVQQPQAVEQFIYIARGLVDVYNNQLAFQRLLLQQVDDLLRIGRRQS